MKGHPSRQLRPNRGSKKSVRRMTCCPGLPKSVSWMTCCPNLPKSVCNECPQTKSARGLIGRRCGGSLWCSVDVRSRPLTQAVPQILALPPSAGTRCKLTPYERTSLSTAEPTRGPRKSVRRTHLRSAVAIHSRGARPEGAAAAATAQTTCGRRRSLRPLMAS